MQLRSGNNYVLKDGTDVNPPAADKDAPQLTGQLNIKEKTKWTLTGNADYLKAITSVKYGEEELDTTVNDTEITIDTSELPVGTHKLTIEADGYKSQVIEVIIESDGNAGEDEGVEGLTFEKAHVKYWFDDYDTYRLTFTDEKINDVSRDLYLKAIDYIEVGDVKYSYGTPDISKTQINLSRVALIQKPESRNISILQLILLILVQTVLRLKSLFTLLLKQTMIHMYSI